MAKNGCSCCVGWRPTQVSLALDEQNWATKLFTSHSSHARRARPDSFARKLALWLTPDWRIRANCRVVKASFLVKTHSSFLGFQPRLRVAALKSIPIILCISSWPWIHFFDDVIGDHPEFYMFKTDPIFSLVLNIAIFDFLKFLQSFWGNMMLIK